MENRDKVGFRAATGVLVLLILTYYVWTAATNGAPLFTTSNDCFKKMIRGDEIDPQHYGYYNLLADAFLSGQLALLVEPAPQLLAMPDPYDRAISPIYRLHDASLYKGRYYLYFGPVPALSLFIPFRLVTARIITEPFGAALFGFGAFLLSVLVLVTLARRITPAVSQPLLLLAILALGISNSMPFVLRRPVVYEVAITAGAFFIMLGFFALVRSWRKETPSRTAMACLSLCWGLSVGCRPVYIIAAPVLAGIWIYLLWKDKTRMVRKGILDGLALFLPFAFCIFLLGLYNFLRFDSWTEFGLTYELAGVEPQMFRLGNILPGLYQNIIKPPRVDFVFPFFHLVTGSSFLAPGVYTECVAGFLATSPIAIFLCASLRRRKFEGRSLVTLMTVFGLSIVGFEAFLFAGTTMRYQLDSIFPLLSAALLLWLWLDSLMTTGWRKRLVRTLSIGLVFYGICNHVAIGFTGYYDLFKRSHPRQYFACEDFVSPVSRFLLRFSKQKSPEIWDAFSLAGNGTLPDQTPFEWIGSNGYYITFFSPKDATYRFAADFFVNHAARDLSGIQLRLIADRATPNENIVCRDLHLRWTVKVKRGVHRIVFLATPLEEGIADVDAHQLLLMARSELVDMVNGQQVRYVKR